MNEDCQTDSEVHYIGKNGVDLGINSSFKWTDAMIAASAGATGRAWYPRATATNINIRII